MIEIETAIWNLWSNHPTNQLFFVYTPSVFSRKMAGENVVPIDINELPLPRLTQLKQELDSVR